MDQDVHIHMKRSWIATGVTLVVLGLLGLFVLRVLFYADQLRSGGVDPSALSLGNQISTTIALTSAPVKDGLFDLVTLDDPSLGSKEASVTIVEFADFGCPYSRESSFVIRELANKYPEQVRFVYRDFPLSDLHPIAQKAAEAGECAQDQGKFWEYHDKLYQNQVGLTEARLVEYAQSVNMNVYQFESCLNSGRYADEVIEDYQAGVEAGVRGTPTFFINGNRVAGAIPADVFDVVVQSILNRDL